MRVTTNRVLVLGGLALREATEDADSAAAATAFWGVVYEGEDKDGRASIGCRRGGGGALNGKGGRGRDMRGVLSAL